MRRFLILLIFLIQGCSMQVLRGGPKIKPTTMVCLGESYEYKVSVTNGDKITLKLKNVGKGMIDTVTFLRSDCIVPEPTK